MTIVHVSTPLGPELVRFAVIERGGKASGEEIKFLCPIHESDGGNHKPSASYNPKKGAWQCFSCGAKGSYRDLADLLGVQLPSEGTQSDEKVYEYVDADGITLFEVVRTPEKKFFQRVYRPEHPEQRKGYIKPSQAGIELVLYRLPRVLKAVQEKWSVYVVEGEKDVHTLEHWGLTATCNPMGAGKWKEQYTTALTGADVVLIPDDDEPGRDHAVKVQKALQGKAASFRVVQLPNPTGKKGFDVTDWKNSGGTKEELLTLVESTPVLEVASTASEPEPKKPAPVADDRDNPYRIQNGMIYHDRMTQNGIVPSRLCNFTAKIVSAAMKTDGVDTFSVFTIEGAMHSGYPLPTVEVSAKNYNSLEWIMEHWGGYGALPEAKQSVKDHLRAAIFKLSGDWERKHLYTFTGWVETQQGWGYLHSGGAITAQGLDQSIGVHLDGPLGRYALPEPPEGEALKNAVRASLDFLNLAPDTVTVPLLFSAYRAVLGGCDFAIWLYGLTGQGKSELAALIQQHFGAEMHAKNLPASWLSTANALFAQAFTAKDALLVVDDFKPEGTSKEVQALNSTASRLLRAQGNNAGRGRAHTDGSLRAEKPPRGLVVSTAEELPRGHSILARCVVVELPKNGLDWEKLSQCQKLALEGVYSQSMAGFLKWIAPQYNELQKTRALELLELRSGFTATHKRTSAASADLAYGAMTFLDFALEVQAINETERDLYRRRTRDALKNLLEDQEGHQNSNDPVLRFFELFQALLDSKQCHLADTKTEEVPEDAELYGWIKEGTGFRAGGKRIGWVSPEGIFLDHQTTYAEIQGLAVKQGESFTMSARTLLKRLHEAGLSVGRAGKNTSYTTIGGSQRYNLLQIKNNRKVMGE